MKANPDKCHLLLSTKDERQMKLGNASIKNSNCEKLLGVKIDSDMSFNTHLNDICNKASQKIHALARRVFI